MKRDVARMSSLAGAGDARAQAWMGLLSQNRGEVAEALHWYELAAKSDNRFALGQLFFLHRRGLGTPSDMAKAAHWVRRGAELGHAELQRQYAAVLLNGEGVDRNETEAARWYRRAVESGDCYSALPLAKLAVSGIGMAHDPVAAYAYAEFADFCMDTSATGSQGGGGRNQGIGKVRPFSFESRAWKENFRRSQAKKVTSSITAPEIARLRLLPAAVRP